MSLRIFVLRLHRVKRLQKFFILGLVVESSTSNFVKCKSKIDTACDRRLNSPQSANCGRFSMVAQRDLEVFEKYSQLCAKYTTSRISSDAGRTTNVGS
ncbi:hypothetical protein Tco_0824394 [Tanacetum coccineum]|uniref:Secreted protein n=1 Tax=Tanacetum coccineum TaxID=301880 RepID=A0ABQ5AKT4_9ASTR